ncbi:MAG: hypothetical protein V1831_01280 [Candidatus Woesearchaeota archaeon]
MAIMNWYNKKLKKLNIWDIGALKTYCLLTGIVIGAYIPGFVNQYFWILIAIIAVLMVKLMYKVFKK